jgi:hypothetical protein
MITDLGELWACSLTPVSLADEAFDLRWPGLHFDAANRPGMTSEDLEIRRRVVWGAFGEYLGPSLCTCTLVHVIVAFPVLDKIHSLYQYVSGDPSYTL